MYLQLHLTDLFKRFADFYVTLSLFENYATKVPTPGRYVYLIELIGW